MLVLFNTILNIIFPKSPAVLALEETKIENLPKVEREPPHGIESIFDYRDDRVRVLVWEIKYRRNLVLAKQVSKILFEHILESISDQHLKNPVIVPTPMHWLKKWQRGFNQTELLASFCKKYDAENIFEYQKNILKKKKYTGSQTKLDRQKRLENIVDSFTVSNPEKIRGRNVVLIDDVTTTGATIREAKKVLRAAGAKKILAITLAH